MHHLSRRGILAAGAALPLLAARPGRAADWPTRPLRLIVPFSPAGTTDIVARLVAERLGSKLGQPVVVENRAGAGGNIGAEVVARAEPDGLTLLMTTIGTGAINYALYPNMPYKPADLAAVSNVCNVPNVILVPANSPSRDLAGLMAEAKRRPGALNHASSGIGTSLHLTGELLKRAAGVEMTHVPYRGSGPMLTELVAGRVEMAVDNLPSALAQIRGGTLRAVAVTGATRSEALPDVPTTAEAGFPTVQAVAWFGVQAPSRTPRPVVERISAEIQAAVREPAFRAKLVEQGAEPVGDTPDQFEAFIRSEIAKWGEVVRQAKVTMD